MQIEDDQLIFQDEFSKKWAVLPLDRIVSASTNSGLFWINYINENGRVDPVFVDYETYRFINNIKVPIVEFKEDNYEN